MIFAQDRDEANPHHEPFLAPGATNHPVALNRMRTAPPGRPSVTRATARVASTLHGRGGPIRCRGDPCGRPGGALGVSLGNLPAKRLRPLRCLAPLCLEHRQRPHFRHRLRAALHSQFAIDVHDVLLDRVHAQH